MEDQQRAQLASRSSVESLPDSLLEEILGSVSRQTGRLTHGLVSRRWSRLACGSFLLRVNVRSRKEMPEDILLKQITPCPGITSLELSAGALESVSDDLLVAAAKSWPGLECLVVRHMQHNLITYWGLRDLLRKCTGLQTLILQGLDDVGIPEVLPRLESLRRVEISTVGGTVESEAKYSGADLAEMEEILSKDCYDRRTRMLDSESKAIFLETAKALSGAELGLPQDWTPWISLRKLHLIGNNVQEIPSSLAKLTQLRDLFLNFEALEEYPAALCNLPELTSLHLQSLELASLPESLGNLKKLRHLKLACPELRSLPASIEGLPNLETLVGARYIFDLPVTSPTSLCSLTNLEAGSCLYSLPRDLPNFRNLRELTFRSPRTSSHSHLPVVIWTLSELTSLTISFGTFMMFLVEDDEGLSAFTSGPSTSSAPSPSLNAPSASRGLLALSKLQHLRLNNLSSLRVLPHARYFPSLISLTLSYCHTLRYLPEDLHLLATLESLDVAMCSNLRALPGGRISTKSGRASASAPAVASTSDRAVASASVPAVASTSASALVSTSAPALAWSGLKRLSLISCPRLFSHGRMLPVFPVLEELHVTDSPLEQMAVPPSCKKLCLSECAKLRVIRPQTGNTVSGSDEAETGSAAAGETKVAGGAEVEGAARATGRTEQPAGVQLERGRASELQVLSVRQCPLLVKGCPGGRGLLEQMGEGSENESEEEGETVLGGESLRFFPDVNEMVIGHFKAAQRITSSLGCLTSMVSLQVHHMSKLKALPGSIGCLAELRQLQVTACTSLERLPDCLPRLHKLVSLRLEMLPLLKSLPDGMESLAWLSVHVSLCPRLKVSRLLKELPSLSSQSRACLGALPLLKPHGARRSVVP